MSQLVDIYGQPISSKVLAQSQVVDNSQVGSLLKQFEHPSEGLTPAKLTQVLKAAEGGDLSAQADLAKDMEDKDGHLFSELSKRRRAWLKFDWTIEPPRNASKQEEKDAEQLKEQLQDATWLTDLIFDLSDGILKGFSACELNWDYFENRHDIVGYQYRDQKLFTTHPEDYNELRLVNGTVEGEALNPFGWVKHVHKSKSGYIHRAGLTSVLAWPYLFKNYSIRDLAEFLEIYGLPLRLGKYPSGASEEEKTTLLRAVLSIGHNAGGVIPKGMDIDFHNAADGQSSPFEAMIRWCELTQSKAVLGATLTSQADGKTSTNALGNVHLDVMDDLVESDLHQVANTITRDVIYPLHALNSRSYSGPRRIPRFSFDLSQAEDISQLAPGLRTLVELGTKIPMSWLHDKTQIPEAKDGEAVLSLSTPEVQPQQDAPTALKALAALKSNPSVDTQDELDKALDAIATGEQSPEYEAMLAPLFEDLAQGPELAQVTLEALYPTLSHEQLTEYLSRLMFAAELLGEADA
ncbi:DUF935 domain-containing protein [Pseudoalteromonas sp. CO325X]|uniref:DUF935 domain-containing protein n=1 Tax=Pseudoalteromonas sp. CO325X TaxID=1777262 RepID=UPI001022DBDD|nr:DUF935 domain-containing protein [Pseudoalteromonas sp. CO325X]RZF83718.1 DUF935 domain-containing protein [Pseudoalteromonas sp. CO325X]